MSYRAFKVSFVWGLVACLTSFGSGAAIAANDGLANSCTTLLQQLNTPSAAERFSRYKIRDIQAAKNILNSWTELGLKEYMEYHKSNPDALVFVRIKSADKPTGVLGEVELFEFTEDYAVFAIRDSAGRIHAVDLDQNDISVHIADQAAVSDMNFIDRFTVQGLYQINLTRLQEYSPSREAVTAQSLKIQHILNKSANIYRFKKIKNIYEKIAGIAARSTMPTIFFWGGSAIARALGIGSHNFILQHASNFYFGLVGMALMHGSLSTNWPSKRFFFLTLTALTNLGFNTVEELDFGNGRLFSGSIQQYGSDWIDFYSGLTSIAVYFAIVAIVETMEKATDQSKSN